MALAIAGMLMVKQHRGATEPHWMWMSCALAVMGTLDLFHAAALPGDSFVWLHSIATFLGGILFLGVWVRRSFPPAWARWLPSVLFVAAFVLGIVSCLWPALVPTMIEDGRFTVATRMLNIAGGLGFGSASWFFVRRFHRESRRDDWLFAVTTQLFAGAGLLFELSALWDAGWWWWHILRLVAYTAACVFAISTYMATEFELHHVNRRLTNLNRDLDRLVADRTARVAGQRGAICLGRPRFDRRAVGLERVDRRSVLLAAFQGTAGVRRPRVCQPVCVVRVAVASR